MGPFFGRALLAAALGVALANVAEKLFRRRGGRRLRVGPPDVDAGVVVGSPDPRATVGLDVDRGGHVELPRPGAVAHFPDREELSQPAAVARGQGCCDGEERVRERAGDLPFP